MTPKGYFMTAKEYLAERNRMYDKLKHNADAIRGHGGEEYNNIDQAIDIVSEWSKAHPRKTYKDDFLEKFPKAKIEEADFPICRIRVYGGSCNSVLCTDCWNKPMEQEVTK